jgi:hypothetical protein
MNLPSTCLPRPSRALAALLILSIAALGACKSDTEQIARSANTVSALAHDTKAELASARQTGEVGPMAEPHVAKAESNQDAIVVEAAKVNTAVAGVSDDEWAGWAPIKWGAIALSIVGLGFVLWYTGVGFIVKRALLAVGMLIPARALSAAHLDREVLLAHPNSPEVNAAVAAKREDPVYRAAWKKVRKEEDKTVALKHRYGGA